MIFLFLKKILVVFPQFCSSRGKITAGYELKALYSAKRKNIAKEILSFVKKLTKERGNEIKQVLFWKNWAPSN